jgi:hypothetical protein|tara:strand:- start:515 stop:691 length:177 start_codon:yes stop_codon:yes gene_type:complete
MLVVQNPCFEKGQNHTAIMLSAALEEQLPPPQEPVAITQPWSVKVAPCPTGFGAWLKA